jgi:pimeloyl-ACP methyl ester carboxylesterase
MSPKSGRIYARFMSRAADDRTVIAHDYPGYGESAPPPPTPPVSIENYAASLWEVADALDLGQIDLLGYHTGSEVAAEAARQRPGQVGGIVMISAPVFTADELSTIKSHYKEIPLDIAGTRFSTMWERVVAHRGPGVTLEMLAESFGENFRAGENYEWGHRAAFEYAPRFPAVVQKLTHRITVINPNDDMAKQTPRIAPYLANGEVVDQFEWGHGFFDAKTGEAVAVIKNALGS